MRLINCKTVLLEEFADHKEVEYAILSHTWDKGEEILYSDFYDGQARAKKGWRKIQEVCQLARAYGLGFVWVDTCCIDKSSSAELSEAINSMFVWYHGAKVCYAYLADHDVRDPCSIMAESRWFTRGWTLQELIAPANLHFYDQDWKPIGTKQGRTDQLEKITGIAEEILCASQKGQLEETLDSVPVARKMSWASKRATTRVEDTAYCLLGVFGINLPLLYGEGERAFMRLQEEIIRNKNDLSILAWTIDRGKSVTGRFSYHHVFARHPSDFQNSSNIELVDDLRFTPDFALTNKGLKIETTLRLDKNDSALALKLNCSFQGRSDIRIGVYLDNQGGNVFARILPDRFAEWSNKSFLEGDSFTCMTEKKSIFLTLSGAMKLQGGVHCGGFMTKCLHADYDSAIGSPTSLFDAQLSTWFTHGMKDFVGCEYYAPSGWRKRPTVKFRGYYVLFGFGYGYTPWVKVSVQDLFLQQEIQTENWGHLAAIANSELCQTVAIGRSFGPKAISHYINVALTTGKFDGQQMYHIKAHFSEKSDFQQKSADHLVSREPKGSCSKSLAEK